MFDELFSLIAAFVALQLDPKLMVFSSQIWDLAEKDHFLVLGLFDYVDLDCVVGLGLGQKFIQSDVWLFLCLCFIVKLLENLW